MKIGVALYGLGTVGSALVQARAARAPALRAEHGIELEIRHVVVRDLGRPRSAPVDPGLLTDDPRVPLDDPRVHVVVEVMGGLDAAGRVVRQALASGRSVVTANKALVAARGAELEALARAAGATLRYEAAVGGAIPILHALRGALAANRVERVRGIVNGTTNFILTRMEEDRLPLADALARAQALGFAEADPTADVSGLDAAQKLVILARHAFGRWPDPGSVERTGIEHVTLEEVEDAARAGAAIKLVAEASRNGAEGPALRVAPAVVPAGDPLHAIRNETNAVVVEGDFSGPLLFAGPGAGGRPTASAAFADLVEVARTAAARRGGGTPARAHAHAAGADG